MPEQYQVAREYKIYSIFEEMMAIFSKLNDDDIKKIKVITFTNTFMKGVADQKKFVREMKSLVNDNAYKECFNEQYKTCQQIAEKYNNENLHCKKDIDKFADENKVYAQKIELSLNKAMEANRYMQIKNRPSEIVTKCLAMVMDIDPRLFEHLSSEEKDKLKNSLTELNQVIKMFEEKL